MPDDNPKKRKNGIASRDVLDDGVQGMDIFLLIIFDTWTFTENRRPHRLNQGKGGAISQLRKFANMIEDPNPKKRTKKTVIPDSVPSNPMAPPSKPPPKAKVS